MRERGRSEQAPKQGFGQISAKLAAAWHGLLTHYVIGGSIPNLRAVKLSQKLPSTYNESRSLMQPVAVSTACSLGQVVFLYFVYTCALSAYLCCCAISCYMTKILAFEATHEAELIPKCRDEIVVP